MFVIHSVTKNIYCLVALDCQLSLQQMQTASDDGQILGFAFATSAPPISPDFKCWPRSSGGVSHWMFFL